MRLSPSCRHRVARLKNARFARAFLRAGMKPLLVSNHSVTKLRHSSRTLPGINGFKNYLANFACLYPAVILSASCRQGDTCVSAWLTRLDACFWSLIFNRPCKTSHVAHRDYQTSPPCTDGGVFLCTDGATCMASPKHEMILCVLQRLSPCFCKVAPKPLAVGIKRRIQTELPELNGDDLDLFLRWWCSRNAYLRALAVDGSQRYGWSGRRCGDVDQQHRDFARGVLAKRQSRKLVRR